MTFTCDKGTIPMAQITIYLDKETEGKVRAYVKGKNISQSQWVASIIREKLKT
jgi:hypothetical protein